MKDIILSNLVGKSGTGGWVNTDLTVSTELKEEEEVWIKGYKREGLLIYEFITHKVF